MRKSLLVLLILLLAVSCSDKNPVNSGNGAGTAVIICTITTEQAAKPAVLKPTTSAIISFYDSNDALLTQKTLTVSGKRITGSVKVKAGSGYRVELLCYDNSDNITHSGTASNVSIVANKTTTITILLTPAIPEAPQADGPDSAMVSGTQYTITWTEVSRAKSYTIEEALNSSFTNPVQKTIVGTSESYTKNTDVSTDYYYRVRANNSAGNSAWSNTVEVVIEPVPAKKYTLTMAVNQSGWGTTTPSVGSDKYDENAVVNITAAPAEGYRFVNWTGDTADPDSSSTTVTMTGDKTLTANFEEIPPVEYTISGTVTGADGVLLTMSGDTSDSQIVNDGGSYSFTVEHGGNYTVTPLKAGFKFTPESMTFSNVTSHQTQDFTASEVQEKQYTLTMSVNQSNRGTTSPSAGLYTYNEGTVVTITATPAEGYRFVNWTGGAADSTAASTTVTMTGDKTVTAHFETVTFFISGIVSGADGVTVTLSGDKSKSITVNDGAAYSFTVVYGGYYEVTLSKTFYTFTPSGKSFSHVTSNQTQSFTAIQNTHEISGKITGASGVTILLSGDASDSLIVNTDGGSYSFAVGESGDYTVTPSEASYTFTPASRSFSYVTSDKTQDFSAVKITYTISGTVTGADGITVTLSGDATDSIALNDGDKYSFTVEHGGNYTVKPSKSGYTLTPANKTFNNVTSHQTQDFTASKIQYTLTIAVNQSGWGTTNPSAGTHKYDEGTEVKITATPAEGYRFVNWTGGAADSTAASTTVTMTGDKTVIARYTEEISGELPEGLVLVSIPGGSFRMGDISGGGYPEERPVHDLTISSFVMGKYEVTQEQYEAIMGGNPSYFSGTSLPVEKVSWYDAVKFCNLLSDEAGLERCYDESSWSCDFSKNGFRLPTEAEWEYACRAGTTTKYYTGDNDSDLARAGWYWDNSSPKTHSVGQKTPNAFGLYDMHGNVWEWCNDWHDGDYYESSPSVDPTGGSSYLYSFHVWRGGSWDSDAKSCRSASRNWDWPSGASEGIFGFRIVRRL